MSILEKQYHEELKMELKGVQYLAGSNANKQNSADDTEAVEESLPEAAVQQVAEDVASMAKVLMPRRKRKLYEAMKVKLLIILCCLYFDF